jgi:tight adherence protein B
MLTGAALAAALLATGPAAAQPGSTPTPELEVSGIRVTAGQVQFLLAGRHLPSGATLDQPNLRIEADGIPLDATVEASTTAVTPEPAPPRGVVLVLDSSGSMADEGRLDTAKVAALEFADGLSAEVALGLVAVSGTPVSLLEPAVDRIAFADAVGPVTAGGDTALYDGVALAVDLLAARTGDVDQRIVVVSDGEDTTSVTDRATVSARLASAGLTVDVVALGTTAAGSGASALASGTGGRVLSADDAAGLRSAFASAASALSPPVLVTATVPADLAGREVELVATLIAGDRDAASATSVVRLAASPTAVTAGVFGAWLEYLALGAVAAAFLLVGFVVVFATDGRARVRRRIRQVDSHRTARPGPAPGVAEASPVLRAALHASEHVLARGHRLGFIETQLERAGMTLRPAEWLLVRTGAAATGALLLTVLLLPWWAGVPLGALAGWVATGMYRRLRAQRRARHFADQLPDALQLVISALRSGFSFAQAIDSVVKEGTEPVASEFGRAVAETRLGGELTDALLGTAQRTDSLDLSWLVMAIRIQREVGGNLSEVLQTAVDTIRERAKLRRHVRTLSAEGRLSAWVLAGMPVAVGGWVFLTRPEYLRPLYTEPLGLVMLTGGLIAMVLGTFWISRVIKVVV